MCLFSMGRGAIVTSVMFTLWLLFLKKEEFPGRSGDVVRGIHLICPYSFRVFLSSGRGVLTLGTFARWNSYLLFLAAFETSQKWWFPLVISHADHRKAVAGYDAGPQPLASIQKSGWRALPADCTLRGIPLHGWRFTFFLWGWGIIVFPHPEIQLCEAAPSSLPCLGLPGLGRLCSATAVQLCLTLGVALGLMYRVKESVWR